MDHYTVNIFERSLKITTGHYIVSTERTQQDIQMGVGGSWGRSTHTQRYIHTYIYTDEERNRKEERRREMN